MKISSILSSLFTLRAGHIEGQDAAGTAWIDDPYAHPAISVMNERERADLPPFHMAARLAMDVSCATHK